jgi:pSer/pThr/pTyr-binding forkhead associated (FHA) protein
MEAKLVVVSKRKAGMEIPISASRFLVGRGKGCQFRVESEQVSRRHCMILADGPKVAIEDCGSVNGTFVNGEKIQGQCALHDGDRIAIGKLVFAFQREDGAEGGIAPMRNARTFKGSMVARAALDDVAILHWLEEDGDEEEMRECWLRPEKSAQVSSEDENGTSDADEKEQGAGVCPSGMELGIGMATFGEEPSWMRRIVLNTKKSPRKAWLFLRALAIRVYRLPDSLYERLWKMEPLDLVLLAAIVSLLVVVMMILFPVTLEWGKAVINVRKWPFWVWTILGCVVLTILVRLRSRFGG